MALFNGEGFNELLSDLKTNGDMLDVAAPEILEAGAAVVADAWRDAIKAHDLIDSGDMLESVGHSEIVNTETEKKVAIYPQGRDHKGVRNAEKAYVLHYGTSKIHGSHWVDEADQDADPMVQDVFEKIWDRHLKGG